MDRRPAVDRGSVRRLLWLVTGLFFLVGVGNLASGELNAISRQEPLDLDINLVAAHRLVHRQQVYDGPASRARAIEIGGPSLKGAYTQPTNSFVGPPATALLHVPFLALDHNRAVEAFRLAALIGMLGAVALTAQAVEKGSRLPAAALGAAVLLASFGMTMTLELGQGHEFVMLGLATAIWGASTGRWRTAGAGIALAAVLKISPVLLLVYLLLRVDRKAKRDAIAGFLVAVSGMVVSAAVVGRPLDILVWVRDVAPGLSGGVVRTINQSVPGFLSRLASGELGSTAPLGPVRVLGMVGAIGALALLTVRRRNHDFDPMEFGTLVLVGLLMGPLSWMHYATWAVLPLVLLADPRRWTGLGDRGAVAAFVAVVVAAWLLTVHVGDNALAGRYGLAERLTSSPYLLAELLLLVVCATRFLPATARSEQRGTPTEQLGQVQSLPG